MQVSKDPSIKIAGVPGDYFVIEKRTTVGRQELAAWCRFRIAPASNGKAVVELVTIYTKEQHRHKGHAAELLHQIKGVKGIAYCFMMERDVSAEIKGFLEKQGFIRKSGAMVWTPPKAEIIVIASNRPCPKCFSGASLKAEDGNLIYGCFGCGITVSIKEREMLTRDQQIVKLKMLWIDEVERYASQNNKD